MELTLQKVDNIKAQEEMNTLREFEEEYVSRLECSVKTKKHKLKIMLESKASIMRNIPKSTMTYGPYLNLIWLMCQEILCTFFVAIE